MRLAFVAFHYFPYGGLTRDMQAMAELCQQRGHDVVIYVGSWQGDSLPHLKTKVLAVKKTFSNAGFNAAFVAALKEELTADPGRMVIGFNKMPGLDLYYAADSCFAAKAQSRSKFYRSTRRAKRYLMDEQAVFSASSITHCLMISKPEIEVYQRFYQTPDARLHLLPPGIRRDRIMPKDYQQRRQQLRTHYSLDDGTQLILMVGSNYKLKGLDRALKGLAALPEERRHNLQLWIAGQGKPTSFQRLANQLALSDQLRILGPRDDISELMWAADVFLHPAYMENTGTVILEAMVAGLPVVTTSVCGYSSYVTDHHMGEILDAPVTGNDVAEALQSVLTKPRSHWLELSHQFAKEDIYSMTERACELIENLSNSHL